MHNPYEAYEDTIRLEKIYTQKENIYSRYCDFIYYQSSVDPELTLAMRILKPEQPSYIQAGTHGWHMSIPKFEEYSEAQSKYLRVDVDMRGRAFSDGQQDCNGWELLDVIDAIEYVKRHYSEYILDPDVVYFQSGSGGGGNAFAIAGKFPDYFAHVVSMCGMSDYALWHRNDQVGEFRDELDVWVGDIQNEAAYASRSGITFVENLCAPMAITHGDGDIRVPEYHSAQYVRKAQELGKGDLVTYKKLVGIGGKDHFTNITPEGMDQVVEFCETQRSAHRQPVRIPRKGRMVIGGYLYTKDFSVILDSIDKLASIEYDLDRQLFRITGVEENEYTLYLP